MRIFGLGPMELMIILAILLLLFGPKQIPKLSRMFGKSIKDLREGLEGKSDEEDAPGAKSEMAEGTVPGKDEADQQKKDEKAESKSVY